MQELQNEHVYQALQGARSTYLDMLIKVICGSIYRDGSTLRGEVKAFDPTVREYGWDWPTHAHSMIGIKRLNNVRLLAESVLGNNVPGDFIETGVWRGGASILMRGVLQTYGVRDRRVFVADSFQGLPPPNLETYPADAGSAYHEFEELAVPLEEVQSNFAAYDLLDDQVVFLKGWFKDTLPDLPADTLALIRLDGDMYESTMDALVNLYDKLSPGGYLIVDDYHIVPQCKQAVHDFCASKGITPTMEEIDGVGVYWKK